MLLQLPLLLPVLRAAAVTACCHSRCRRLVAAIEPARGHLLSRAANERRSQRRAICSRALLLPMIDRTPSPWADPVGELLDIALPAVGRGPLGMHLVAQSDVRPAASYLRPLVNVPSCIVGGCSL